MYADFYERISKPFRSKPGAARLLSVADKALVIATAAAFAGGAVWLAAMRDTRLLQYLIVCAVSFALLTALRAAINRPRPYEAWQIDPLIRKDTKGKSFPSRHLFSASLISCAFLWIEPAAGIVCFAATAVLGVIRIVGGVHYPADVAAGIAAGIACALVGFWIV